MSIRAWHSCKLRSQASDSILRWQELPEGLEWSSVVGFFFFYNEASADLLLPGESGQAHSSRQENEAKERTWGVGRMRVGWREGHWPWSNGEGKR